MAYKIIDNTRFALSDERENGFIVLFGNKDDFENYEFADVDGKAIVEALWSPSGYVDSYSLFFSKVWFAADKVRSFNDLHIVKRDPAYPRFIEAPVIELKQSVLQALLSCSLKEVSDDDLQDIADLGGFGSRFVDKLRRAREEVKRFANSWRCRDGSVLPAHDQKALVRIKESGETKRVDPSALLYARDRLLLQLTPERFHRELYNISCEDAWQRFQDAITTIVNDNS